MRLRKILISVFAAILLTTSVGAYTAQRSYDGEFNDVSASTWYYGEVASAYSLGLINGKSGNSFDPDGNLTIAETIKLAVSCHQLLTAGETTDLTLATSNWYDGYVDYATKNSIVTEEYSNYSAAATRAQVAVLFSRALTAASGDTNEINTVEFGSLPDVRAGAWYATPVYHMYRLGIMTGDSSQCIYPDSAVKRSEIAAIVMRMIDSNARVHVEGPVAANPSASAVPEQSETTGDSAGSKLVLYSGTMKEQNITGISGIGADFSVSNGKVTVDSACMLSLAMDVALEKDCLSFRLYEGCGYESLSIARGWLDDAAVGVNGIAVHTAAEKYDVINSLIYLYVNGTRIPITQLWYTDHTDSNGMKYTAYAFYFTENLDFSTIYDVKFLAGRQDSDILEASGLSELSNLNKTTTVPLYSTITASSNSDETSQTNDDSVYRSAISSAKTNATEIIFEYESGRCCILYGRGLYGGSATDYRLVLIFQNGTTQTVYIGQLDGIRVSSAGNVLYYTVVGPDGMSINYGVNFN